MVINSLTPQAYKNIIANDETSVLADIGFTNIERAFSRLKRMANATQAPDTFFELLPPLLTQLARIPNPDNLLVNFERLAHNMDNPHELYQTLAENPRATEILTTVMSASQFLTEILLRTPNYFKRLITNNHLTQIKSLADFENALAEQLASANTLDEQLDILRRFQRWQILRIGTADLLGLFDMPTVTIQLSHLADSLIRAALKITAHQIDINPNGFVVLAMGKLGGAELNYSSDIDLLFLSADGDTTFQKLGKKLIDALTRVTAEGFLYRVDMRLRPWGSVGALVTSVSGHLAYLQKNARMWEKQALLKARIVAGDESIGEEFLANAQPMIFAFNPENVQADVRDMKARIEKNLRKKGRGWGEVKLGEGSIRDIEFIAQYLQLAYGDTHPQVRARNTLLALGKLTEHGFLSQNEHRILSEGYTFLRSMEHWLQMTHNRQTHTLPTDRTELSRLAHRLGFADDTTGETMLTRYQRHTQAIRAVYQRYLNPESITDTPAAENPIVQKHMARLAPVYAETFTPADIAEHAVLAHRLSPQHLSEISAQIQSDGTWRVTVIAYDYLGELSLICGLFFAHGFDIHAGNVFTYRPKEKGQISPNERRKIVDVFIVSPAADTPVTEVVWQNYADNLRELLADIEFENLNRAQRRLAQQLGKRYQTHPLIETPILYPIDIEIDNIGAPHRTILRIDTVDTLGFLYELTNAMAMAGTHITRMSIGTAGNRVSDELHITTADGGKITQPEQLRELRATIVLTKHFTHLLPHSPNPTAALLHFRQFLRQLFDRPDWTQALTSLEEPKVLRALTRLLGVSDFLWTDFLRMQYANLFPVLQNIDELSVRKNKADLEKELSVEMDAQLDKTARIAALNAFKDREMFRIDMRHILRHITQSGQFAAELTDLADVVVGKTFSLIYADLLSAFGTPRLPDGNLARVSVCALGKCGGQELGFASDIELMLVYESGGFCDGEKNITTAEFFDSLVQTMPTVIQSKRAGIFELDFRLRPHGQSGSLAVPLNLFKSYYAPDGVAWAYERQSLLKLRPIAGDENLGAEIVAFRDSVVYSGIPFDVAALRGMRERQIRHWVTPGSIHAKLSPGGLVDIEYLIQALQIMHGPSNPYLRTPNTRAAMTRLAEVGLLRPDDFTALLAAHKLLRRLINALRMVHGNAKDLTVPSTNSEEFAFLARRLHYGDDLAQLSTDLSASMQAVIKISNEHLEMNH